MADTMVREATDPTSVANCFDAYRELRPHLESADDLVSRWTRQAPEGFRMAYIAGADGRAEAVIGYRILTTTAWGQILYVDDLCTRSDCRRRGLGATLLDYAGAVAQRSGCDAVHLDSGHQRHEAHRLYVRHGFENSSLHFARSTHDPDDE